MGLPGDGLRCARSAAQSCQTRDDVDDDPDRRPCEDLSRKKRGEFATWLRRQWPLPDEAEAYGHETRDTGGRADDWIGAAPAQSQLRSRAGNSRQHKEQEKTSGSKAPRDRRPESEKPKRVDQNMRPASVDEHVTDKRNCAIEQRARAEVMRCQKSRRIECGDETVFSDDDVRKVF